MPPETVESTSFSLLERVRDDDQAAWSQLVHLYGPLVDRWCRRAGLSDADTADVFQESFRTVAARIGDFSPHKAVGAFRSWLRTIVRTRIIDHLRRWKLQNAARGGTEAQQQIASLVDPRAGGDGAAGDGAGSDGKDFGGEDSDALDENALIVQRAMELIRPEFSARNWRAFQQVALQGQSAADAAEQLGVAPQTIRQANYRIRRRLRKLLQHLVEP